MDNASGLGEKSVRLAAMPGRREIPPALTHGPFRASELTSAGISRSILRGARFTRPTYGVYQKGAPADLGAVCRALAVGLPDDAAFSDESALLLIGMPVPAFAPTVVHVTTTRTTSAIRRRGVAGHVRNLAPDEVMVVDGLRVTVPSRILIDLAGRISKANLVAIGDAMLRAGLVTIEELRAACVRYAGSRGVVRLREALDVMNPRAESPRESILRVLLLDADLPIPEVNPNVYDDRGIFIARVDLLFREQRVVVEYDGDQHRSDKRQFARDVRRLSQLAAAGYVVLRFTVTDVYQRPHYVIATVRAALARGTRPQTA